MPLVNCPECSRQVSTAADACPQCGYPMQSASPAPVGPKCHACAAAATTRCQSCGALSCVQHLQIIDLGR
ncbi:MAG: zinc ribbon domain-containing protein, partial [Planctomycetaceae bacterium]